MEMTDFHFYNREIESSICIFGQLCFLTERRVDQMSDVSERKVSKKNASLGNSLISKWTNRILERVVFLLDNRFIGWFLITLLRSLSSI
jgi:hypothetical protein